MASEDCGGRIDPKEEVDRISNLPDEVISRILSLLPIECAFGTSILSNRWKYHWTSIASLHFERHGYEDKDFNNFVDKVFCSCDSSNIQKLTLHVWYNSRLEAWIDEAIKRKVTEVDIDVHKLPSSLFQCTTLTVLKLVSRYFWVSDNYSFDLPCLRVLYIKGPCQPKFLMEKLISSCPVLEDLTIDGYPGYDGWFRVHSPILKSLLLQLWSFGDCKISVNAPNLEHLNLSGSFFKYKIKGNFPSLVKTTMIIGDVRLDGLHKTIHIGKRGLPSDFTIPNFDNLKCLEVVTFDHLFWTMLPKLIRKSPSLEVLSIKQCGDNMPPDEFTWVGPKRAPKCLHCHLATIKLEGFKGRKHELEMLAYVLGKAKVLQRLIIDCEELKCVEKMEFSEQLLKIQRLQNLAVLNSVEMESQTYDRLQAFEFQRLQNFVVLVQLVFDIN